MNIDNLNKPESTLEFEKLSEAAYSYLFKRQEECEQKYKMFNYESWFYNQDTGLLTFSDKNVVKIEIIYEQVGTILKSTNTWLWSWENPHIEEQVKKDILQVKEYGVENNIESLTKPKWRADEYDGWEMTAIAAYLLKAKGAYRFPLENTFSFVIFKEIYDRRVESFN